MTKWTDWNRATKKMSIEDLKDRKAALQALIAWPMFKKEFGWAGLYIILEELEAAISYRELGIFFRAVVYCYGKVQVNRIKGLLNSIQKFM